MVDKILVVEDNDQNRILVKDLLQYHGYEVLEACDGARCLDIWREHRPRLVLLDIQMPDMDGYETLKLLREIPGGREVKVVALTAFSTEEDWKKISRAGFDGYLCKPFGIDNLAKLVKRLLQ